MQSFWNDKKNTAIVLFSLYAHFRFFSVLLFPSIQSWLSDPLLPFSSVLFTSLTLHSPPLKPSFHSLASIWRRACSLLTCMSFAVFRMSMLQTLSPRLLSFSYAVCLLSSIRWSRRRPESRTEISLVKACVDTQQSHGVQTRRLGLSNIEEGYLLYGPHTCLAKEENLKRDTYQPCWWSFAIEPSIWLELDRARTVLHLWLMPRANWILG